MRERHLDDVETIQGIPFVRRVTAADASGHLGVGARELASGDVDVHDALVGWARDHRVRVRALARLHVLDEAGCRGVGDVVDADARHVVRRVLHTTLRAVVAVATAFRGDEEQVADDRRITLRGDACNGGHHHRMHRIADIPDGEAGEVALIDVVIAERDVGVDERQAAHGVELRGFGREGHQPHALCRLAGVEHAVLQPVARIVAGGVGLCRRGDWQREDERGDCDTAARHWHRQLVDDRRIRQQLAHRVDLCALHRDHVVGEDRDVDVLRV